MRWLLLMNAYAVGFVASLASYGARPELFNTVTNLVFALPLLVLAVIPSYRTFMPTTLFLSLLLCFGSFIHHYHLCQNATYRVFDHAAYLLLYAYLVTRCLWDFLCGSRLGRFFARFSCVVFVACTVCLYENIMRNSVLRAALAGVSACLTVIHSVGVERRQGVASALAAVGLCVYLVLLAYAFDRRSDTTARADLHGMWHVLVGQFQFVLLFTVLTAGPLPDEWVEMLLVLGATLVYTVVCFASDAFDRGVFLAINATFALVTLLRTGWVLRLRVSATCANGRLRSLRWRWRRLELRESACVS